MRHCLFLLKLKKYPLNICQNLLIYLSVSYVINSFLNFCLLKLFGSKLVFPQSLRLTALRLTRCPEQQSSFSEGTPSEEKLTSIIIYNFILFTKFRKQLAFTTQHYNLHNAAKFKAVALICGLYAFIIYDNNVASQIIKNRLRIKTFYSL